MRHHQSRMTEAVCPPWCAGHDELYQPWEDLPASGAQTRSHCSASDSTEPTHVGVELDQEEHTDLGLLEPVVRLFVDQDGSAAAELNAEQAQRVAARLEAAATRIGSLP